MKIKNMKNKIKKFKNSNIKELNEIKEQNNYFLKDTFFHKRTIKELKYLDIDIEIINLIDKYFYFEIIEQSSDYGMDVSYVDFSEIIYLKKGNFFEYIKVDVNEYINNMKIYLEGKKLASW